jgi:hypothetical protein
MTQMLILRSPLGCWSAEGEKVALIDEDEASQVLERYLWAPPT